jgi:hypothetical protein
MPLLEPVEPLVDTEVEVEEPPDVEAVVDVEVELPLEDPMELELLVEDPLELEAPDDDPATVPLDPVLDPDELPVGLVEPEQPTTSTAQPKNANRLRSLMAWHSNPNCDRPETTRRVPRCPNRSTPWRPLASRAAHR